MVGDVSCLPSLLAAFGRLGRVLRSLRWVGGGTRIWGGFFFFLFSPCQRHVVRGRGDGITVRGCALLPLRSAAPLL